MDETNTKKNGSPLNGKETSEAQLQEYLNYELTDEDIAQIRKECIQEVTQDLGWPEEKAIRYANVFTANMKEDQKELIKTIEGTEK